MYVSGIGTKYRTREVQPMQRLRRNGSDLGVNHSKKSEIRKGKVVITALSELVETHEDKGQEESGHEDRTDASRDMLRSMLPNNPPINCVKCSSPAEIPKDVV